MRKVETENIGPFWFGAIYELVCFLDWDCDATGMVPDLMVYSNFMSCVMGCLSGQL